MNVRKLRGTIIELYGSQWGFSQAIEEHESVVSKVIRGRRELSPDKVKIWVEALGLKKGELLKGLKHGQR